MCFGVRLSSDHITQSTLRGRKSWRPTKAANVLADSCSIKIAFLTHFSYICLIDNYPKRGADSAGPVSCPIHYIVHYIHFPAFY